VSTQIQELEDTITELQSQQQAQQHELSLKAAEVSALKQQLTTWRAIKDAEAANLAASNTQLTQQLAGEMARVKAVEGEMGRLQAQLVGGLAVLCCVCIHV
jgi:predicted RNase H-like nuclease (RuvC/YqgF family)